MPIRCAAPQVTWWAAPGVSQRPQELVHGVFLVAGYPGDVLVVIDSGIDAFGRADQEIAAPRGVGRHGHHQIHVVRLDPRRRPLPRDRGRGGGLAEQVELPDPRPLAGGHGDHHHDERAS